MSRLPSSSESRRAHRYAFTRLRLICDEIRSGTYPTKARLAEVVGRTPRTVQRDLEALRSEYDAPIEFDRERHGFRFVDPDWQLPQITLTEGEMLGYFAAEHLIQGLGATAEAELVRGALRKLARLLPEQVVINIDEMAQTVQFAPPSGLIASPRILQKLAQSAVRRRTIRIGYRSRTPGSPPERDLDVLLLYNNLGEYYAIGHDHYRKEVRYFHAGRIRSLVETDRSFEPPADWDKESYLRTGFGMYRGGREVVVEIEFDAYQAQYIRERSIHETERRRELSDGGLRVAFSTTEAALEQVARWVMQYGPHATVVRPSELRSLVREQLVAALAHYQDKPEV